MKTRSGRPAGPAGETPPRHRRSVRRTSSIDTSWPEGRDGPSRLRGVARDMATLSDGSPEQMPVFDVIEGSASPIREILALKSSPARLGLADIVGQRAGQNLRTALDAALPDERDAGSPLYLLLDDLAGVTLVAPWAWSHWTRDWMGQAKQSDSPSTAGRKGPREGVCNRFRARLERSHARRPAGTTGRRSPGSSAGRADDPAGWHPLAAQQGVGMRRARRIDAWRDGDLIRIDSAFQESASTPGGERMGLHEYGLVATADSATGTLLLLEAVPASCLIASARQPRSTFTA